MSDELTPFTYEEALRELERAVNLNGRNHQAGGSIISDERGKPVCIVGHVLFQIDPARFQAVKPQGSVHGPFREMGLAPERDAMWLLVNAQVYQDGHVTGSTREFGDALDYAVSRVIREG